MDAIDIFLENWKKKAYQYYDRIYQEYRNRVSEQSNLSKKYNNRFTLSSDEQKQFLQEYNIKSKEFLKWKYSLPQIIQNMMGWREEEAYKRLNIFLDKEVERKKKSLIKRVEKKVGKIRDVSYLRLGSTGELNGYIIGEKGKVSVETISAGGYNIQCYHYRVLVKDIK